MEFQYNLPVNLIFGRGSVSRIGDIAVDYGSRACIVTGRSSTRKSGLLNRVAEYLEKAGVESVVFDRVEQNPLTTTAMEAAAFIRQENAIPSLALAAEVSWIVRRRRHF